MGNAAATRGARRELQDALESADFARDMLMRRNVEHKQEILHAWDEMVAANKEHAALKEAAVELALNRHEEATVRSIETAEKIADMTRLIGEIQAFVDDKRCDEAVLRAVRPIKLLDKNLAPRAVLEATDAILRARKDARIKNAGVHGELNAQRVEVAKEKEESQKAQEGTTREERRTELKRLAAFQARTDLQRAAEGMAAPQEAQPMATMDELEISDAIRSL